MVTAVAAAIAVLIGFVWAAIQSYELLHGDDVRSGSAPVTRATVTVTGSEEPVFTWRREACAKWDVPDLPARAFRDAGGRVHLISASFVTRAAVGPELDGVRHDCRVLMRSDTSSRPEDFANDEWIASPFTTDGKTVFALVHNEYHGNKYGRCAGDNLTCWYNAVTLARSDDGGTTFRDVRPSPDHFVAGVPYRDDPGAGEHFGVFSPSNIVKKDGYYYAMVSVQPYRAQKAGTCVMRTEDLADPRAWRAWDGDGFDVQFIDPYAASAREPDQHVCEPVSTPEISSMVQSLTYNTYFEKYLLVGTAGGRDGESGREVPGFWYSLSEDLIHWSPRKLIMEAEHLATYRCGDSEPALYPSVLDPESKSRNFETTGQRPYMYFTRFHMTNCAPTANRDLVRVPIEFSK